MPTISITGVEGNTPEQIHEYMRRVTDLAVEVLGAKAEGVIVHFHVLPADRYMRGGRTIREIRGQA